MALERHGSDLQVERLLPGRLDVHNGPFRDGSATSYSRPGAINCHAKGGPMSQANQLRPFSFVLAVPDLERNTAYFRDAWALRLNTRTDFCRNCFIQRANVSPIGRPLRQNSATVADGRAFKHIS